jgi:hypothetical protein
LHWEPKLFPNLFTSSSSERGVILAATDSCTTPGPSVWATRPPSFVSFFFWATVVCFLFWDWAAAVQERHVKSVEVPFRSRVSRVSSLVKRLLGAGQSDDKHIRSFDGRTRYGRSGATDDSSREFLFRGKIYISSLLLFTISLSSIFIFFRLPGSASPRSPLRYAGKNLVAPRPYIRGNNQSPPW